MAAESTTITLKLLIDARGKRVVFAESGKDFVDFLFRILSLPVVTVVSLLGKEGMVGSLANLHGSIENLNNSYMLPNKTNEAFLRPASGFSLRALGGEPPPTVNKFYTCGAGHRISHVSDDPSTICPICTGFMTANLSYIQNSGGGGEGGVVKGLVTYMVMDDLTVMPLSTTSTITVLNKLNVKSVSSLEEKVVHLGMDEAVKLLNASLQSKSVLTDVFLKDMKSTERTERTIGVKRERTSA